MVVRITGSNHKQQNPCGRRRKATSRLTVRSVPLCSSTKDGSNKLSNKPTPANQTTASSSASKKPFTDTGSDRKESLQEENGELLRGTDGAVYDSNQ
ncbi:pancreatic progenitor cell differentiation and proliferation factor isoform X2 [Hyperolius riggenbachi]|uniref:pancreatic progenitor cell differentiation and proliferation factor isoform X2 n=1 Tax=Hyperolius riggenbachi TaxID=752182 RepID=UPI0035A35CDA